jgi:hypothetical protein
MVLPEGIDWDRALDLSTEQCVCAICLEGIDKLEKGSVPKAQLLQWFGQTELQRGQYQFAWATACKLGRLWSAEGINATVLKGRAIAQYYAVPHHRYSCDLDVFIGKGWERVCELMEGRGVQLRHEVYKEVEFTMDDVYVECHRYITPLRGNRQLQAFERYLRSLLESGEPSFFEGTTLVCPPLMFLVRLYVEHAQGDFLHGKLLLKHVVDWVVLRRQAMDWEAFGAKCKEFRFDRFVALMEALADVVEGKREYETLSDAYKEAFDEMLQEQEPPAGQRSWFQRRVSLFFEIIKNGKKFRRYGYTSMPSYLFHSVWTHFFDREVRGI